MNEWRKGKERKKESIKRKQTNTITGDTENFGKKGLERER